MFNFDMLRLSFTLEAIHPISLPSYKGSTFHGGFGHALATISPTWYDYFFQAVNNTGRQIPKPFVLLPPLDTQQHYQSGETFHCELTLFGSATKHYAIVQAAIEFLGNEMGLGYSLGKYKIIDLNSTQFEPTAAPCQNLTISLNTRLRIKNNNRLLKQSPDFAQLTKSIFSRLKTLQHCYATEPVNQQQYQGLLQQSTSIQRIQSSVTWEEWDRYSGSQKEWMKFGGLLGNATYQGDLQPFMNYLQMGEWTHIGGKSSFGLGKYRLHYGDNNEIT